MSEPTRLAGSPPLGEPALGLAPVPNANISPTGLALLPQVAVRIGMAVAALAAIGTIVFTALLPAPFAVVGVSVCGAVTGLCAALGFASPGLRKVEPKA